MGRADLAKNIISELLMMISNCKGCKAQGTRPKEKISTQMVEI